MLFVSPTAVSFNHCARADEHDASGVRGSVVVEQRLFEGVPIRLMRIAPISGAYPDPALAEVSPQIITAASGRYVAEIGLGTQARTYEANKMCLAPACTDWRYHVAGRPEFLIVNLSASWLRWAFEQDLTNFAGGDFGAAHDNFVRDDTLMALAQRLLDQADQGSVDRLFLKSGSLALMSLFLSRSGRDCRQAPPARGGLAPHRYLIRLRVECAQDLLAAPDDSITAVAHACGCASTQHMATVFQGLVGVTPSAYRRERRR
jgi:AraC-like DNA-binding protein